MPKTKFKPQNQVAYDKSPLQFKVLPGVREKIKTVPNTAATVKRVFEKLWLMYQIFFTPP